MKGMEAMIANMLGFTPQEMHETLQGFQVMISSTKETLERIEGKQDEILAQLEGLKNDIAERSNGSKRGSSGNANGRTGRGSSDVAGDSAGT